jgi:hypothetical protein
MFVLCVVSKDKKAKCRTKKQVWMKYRVQENTKNKKPAGSMDVCCGCCVSLDRSLCDGPITPLEESYRLWCVIVCDVETSRMKRRGSLWAVALTRECYSNNNNLFV